jgi:hypothetical protein
MSEINDTVPAMKSDAGGQAAPGADRGGGPRHRRGEPRFMGRPAGDIRHERLLRQMLHVGARQVFADAGFAEVSRPSVRRAVMRIDFDAGDADAQDST